MVDDANEDTLLQQMRSLEQMLEAITPKLTELEAAKREINAEKLEIQKEFEARMSGLVAKDTELRDLLWEAQREVRRVKQEYESAERKYHQAQQVKAQMKAFEDIAERWDQLTAGAPWREWAKDHQIEAAKRMSFQHKMILADGMGLGKTLSAIAAVDIIKAATAEATPDNPVIFDVEKM